MRPGPKHRVVGPELLYPADDRLRLSRADIRRLKELATRNPRGRIRLCAHRSTDDRVHQMFLVLPAGAYVRPHRLRGKSKSFHVLEGRMRVVTFETDGRVLEVLEMGPASSGKDFYLRLHDDVYHCEVPVGGPVVFLETIDGPYRPGDTVYANWAPSEDDGSGRRRFLRRLDGRGTPPRRCARSGRARSPR